MAGHASPVTPHQSRLISHGFFVTGTDTGVGKTVVAAALLHAFAAQGLRAVGMKPVAAGLERIGNELRHADVEYLIAAGNVAAPRELVNPYCFPDPIAPHIGAAQTGTTIDVGRIADCFKDLAALADVVIVEGVGGFRVPLGSAVDAGDLAKRLHLPVILVVGMRLGCLNHALLTQEAISARGLVFAGWVANHVDPAMLAADDNVAALRARLVAPLLARIAFDEGIDPLSAGAQLDLAPLR